MEKSVTKETQHKAANDQDGACNPTLDRDVVRSVLRSVNDLVAYVFLPLTADGGSERCCHEREEGGEQHEEKDGRALDPADTRSGATW